MNRLQTATEERMLASRFAWDYAEYLARVCLWLSASATYSTLSLHDALPIYTPQQVIVNFAYLGPSREVSRLGSGEIRSEEHTSELQSRGHLVCRLLLEKKKTNACLPVGTALRGLPRTRAALALQIVD